MQTRHYVYYAGALLSLAVSQQAFATGLVADDQGENVPEVVITADEGGYTREDPVENFNRAMYDVNDALDTTILEPAAKGYRWAVPAWGRERIGSALENLGAPNYFINSVLQGDANAAFTTFWRFVINSTVGIAGAFDVAKQAGLAPVHKDFGQTLGVYGAGANPYLMVPVIGPSSPRDLVGQVFDSFTNPFNYLGAPAVAAIKVADVVDEREKNIEFIDEIRDESFDPYATIRSAYRQHRKAMVEKAR